VRAGRPLRVVVHPPFFDHDLFLFQGVKDLFVLALMIRHLPEELFDVLQRGFRALLSRVITENQDVAPWNVVSGTGREK
jgi:hypothetical protein